MTTKQEVGAESSYTDIAHHICELGGPKSFRLLVPAIEYYRRVDSWTELKAELDAATQEGGKLQMTHYGKYAIAPQS